MTVTVTKIAKIAASTITLNDLRQLVDETGGFPSTAEVSITANHDVREGSYYTITVTE